MLKWPVLVLPVSCCAAAGIEISPVLKLLARPPVLPSPELNKPVGARVAAEASGAGVADAEAPGAEQEADFRRLSWNSRCSAARVQSADPDGRPVSPDADGAAFGAALDICAAAGADNAGCCSWA